MYQVGHKKEGNKTIHLHSVKDPYFYRLRYLSPIESNPLKFFHLCFEFLLWIFAICLTHLNKELENFMQKKEKNSIGGERRKNNAHIPLPERGCVEARLNSCSITPFAPLPLSTLEILPEKYFSVPPHRSRTINTLRPSPPSPPRKSFFSPAWEKHACMSYEMKVTSLQARLHER